MPADSDEDTINFIELTSSLWPNIYPCRDLRDDVIGLETTAETEQPRRRLTPRKRRQAAQSAVRPALRPAATRQARRRANAISGPIHDLGRPDNQVGKEKKARKTKTLRERTPDEPEEKRTKFGFAGSCSICLEEFGSKPLASTKCGHIFCETCIKMALKKRCACPNCRKILRGPSAYHPIFFN